MAILGTILLVLFVITAVLLLIVVLLQDEQGDGIGGIFGGSSNNSVGMQAGNVLTKFTAVLASMFIVLSVLLLLVYSRQKSLKDSDVVIEKAKVELIEESEEDLTESKYIEELSKDIAK